MKLDVLNDSLSTTDVSKMSVNVDNLTYSLMIDGIYTNKLASVIRELSTNARDSHISAGNEEPFLITVTYNDDSNDVSLSIKDYGLGLNKEDAEKYLCNLNSSNKRESNEAVGCFGIGSKSPFSLVDSYDFNCIKDGELTSLNLFRIKSETPRFLVATSTTDEPNSVECIVKLNTYSLNSVLETIYTELALFDIKPRIKIKSQTTEVLLEPEEFFCTVVETDNFFHLFYKDPDSKIIESLPSIASNYPKFYTDLKTKKKISCGIIGYSSNDVSILMESYSSLNLQDYYILKFELGSDIKFDVSRENIVKDSKTDDLLKEKIFSDFESIDIQEAIKFKTLYNIITNPHNNYSSLFNTSILEESCPEFLVELQNNLFLPQEILDPETQETRLVVNPYRRTRVIDYNFLFSKLEESFFYYKNNLEELSILSFISKTRIRSNYNSNLHYDSDTLSSRGLNFILYPDRVPFLLSIVSLLEKIVVDSSVIWKELYLENVINLTPEFNFLNTLAYNNFLKNYRNDSDVKIKEMLFKPNNISDLDSFKFIIIANHKRLQSMSSLMRFDQYYKTSEYSDNTIISLLSGNKKTVVDKELISNLNILSTKNCISIFDLDSYSEINPRFVSDVKYVAPPRSSRRRTSGTRVVTNEEGEEELVPATHNEFGVKLRNKLIINMRRFVSDEIETLELTSLKFYEYLSKEYENTTYTIPKSLVLISKDIVSTEEERNSLLESNNGLNFLKLIFEIDNEEYYDQIKDVCDCFLKQWNFSINKAPVIELNTKFLDEENLKAYSKILIWMYVKTLNFNSFKNFIESVEEDSESELFSHEESEENSISNPSYFVPSYIEDTLLTRKAISFCKKLNISVDNPYRTGVYERNLEDNTLDFKNISILLNESIIEINSYSVKNSNYSKESFSRRNTNNKDFFDKLNTLKLTTLDSLLSLNDNFLFNKIFNLDYLNSIKEEFNEPLINFNLENFKKLIKEY